MSTHTDILIFDNGDEIAIDVNPDAGRDPGWTRTDHVIGIDELGTLVAESDGMQYGLTDCCGASHKGGEFGIICRSCYADAEETNDMPFGEVSARVMP